MTRRIGPDQIEFLAMSVSRSAALRVVGRKLMETVSPNMRASRNDFSLLIGKYVMSFLEGQVPVLRWRLIVDEGDRLIFLCMTDPAAGIDLSSSRLRELSGVMTRTVRTFELGENLEIFSEVCPRLNRRYGARRRMKVGIGETVLCKQDSRPQVVMPSDDQRQEAAIEWLKLRLSGSTADGRHSQDNGLRLLDTPIVRSLVTRFHLRRAVTKENIPRPLRRPEHRVTVDTVATLEVVDPVKAVEFFSKPIGSASDMGFGLVIDSLSSAILMADLDPHFAQARAA